MEFEIGPFEPLARWSGLHMRVNQRRLAQSFEARVAIGMDDFDRLNFKAILERKEPIEMLDWLFANVGAEFETWAIDHAMVLTRYVYFARQSDAVWFMMRWAGPD